MSSELSYISYMLRLWQTRSSGKQVWRASLESTLTGELQSFASLGSLFDFLRQQTEVMVDIQRQ